MTLYEYILLDEIEQADALWENGVIVADRQEGECMYILYQIEKFYVEVNYCPEQNSIRSFTTFESLDRLTPYLHAINIDGLRQFKPI